MHGKGSYTWGDGAVYEGEWCNDMRHGRGVMYGIDGSVFSGNWWEDEMHGCGTPICTTIFDVSSKLGVFFTGKSTHEAFTQLRFKQLRVLTKKQLSTKFDHAVKIWLKFVADRVESDILQGSRPSLANGWRKSKVRGSLKEESKEENHGNENQWHHHHYHHIKNMLMDVGETLFETPTRSTEDMEEELLHLYAYYKQGTAGPADWRPDGYRSMNEDAVKKLMKWQDLLEMPKNIAMKKFIANVAAIDSNFAISLDAYTKKKAAKFFEREKESKALSAAIEKRTKMYWSNASYQEEEVENTIEGESDGKLPQDNAENVGESSPGTTLPIILYSLIKDRIMTYLRSQHKVVHDYNGSTGEEILTWYISTHAGDLEDLRQHSDPETLVKKVIKHMCQNEGVLIEVRDAYAQSTNAGVNEFMQSYKGRYENRVFKLNPSLLDTQQGSQMAPSFSTMFFGDVTSPEEEADGDGVEDSAEAAAGQLQETKEVEEAVVAKVEEEEEEEDEEAVVEGDEEQEEEVVSESSFKSQESKMSKALSSMASFFTGTKVETNLNDDGAGLDTIEEGEEENSNSTSSG